jgi:hypothetical protein
MTNGLMDHIPVQIQYQIGLYSSEKEHTSRFIITTTRSMPTGNRQ